MADIGAGRQEAVRLGVLVRERERRVPAGRHQPPCPSARRAEWALPLRITTGGVPRALRGVPAACRGRGAAVPGLGLRPLPAGTKHIFVGAGDEPCAMFMTGSRTGDWQVRYPVSGLAARHGVSVDEETSQPKAGVHGAVRAVSPRAAFVLGPASLGPPNLRYRGGRAARLRGRSPRPRSRRRAEPDPGREMVRRSST